MLRVYLVTTSLNVKYKEARYLWTYVDFIAVSSSVRNNIMWICEAKVRNITDNHTKLYFMYILAHGRECIFLSYIILTYVYNWIKLSESCWTQIAQDFIHFISSLSLYQVQDLLCWLSRLNVHVQKTGHTSTQAIWWLVRKTQHTPPHMYVWILTLITWGYLMQMLEAGGTLLMLIVQARGLWDSAVVI